MRVGIRFLLAEILREDGHCCLWDMRLARSLIPVETQLWRQEMKEMRDVRARGRTSIMTFSLAVSERWQKDLQKKTEKAPQKNKSKRHFKKPKTRKNQTKKQKTTFRLLSWIIIIIIFFFGGVFQNVPWTQDLTTVSQKKQKKTKKTRKTNKSLPPSELDYWFFC